MDNVLEEYRKAQDAIPEVMQAWQVYGAGIENVGREGKPEAIPVPEPGPDQLLLRVDANGLCFSDIKIIKLGPDHPRLKGRDLAREPIVLGHECALTVVTVGQGLMGRFSVGQRFIIQADIIYKGKGIAFGYMLPGGLEQFVLVGPEVIDGDEGCYLLPLQEQTGYAEAALTEPWACVEASYRVTHRTNVKAGGRALLYVSAGVDLADYDFDGLNWPSSIVVNAGAGSTIGQIRDFCSGKGITVGVIADNPNWANVLQSEGAGTGFDDVVVLGAPAPEVFEGLAGVVAKNGVVAVAATKPLARSVSIDVGRIHYEHVAYVGTSTGHVLDAYASSRGTDLSKGGCAWMVGAGGPMGQMHLQRALEIPDGPRKVVATDLDLGRLETLKDRFASAAEEHGISLHLFNPNAMAPGEFQAQVQEISGDRGFDEIAVMVPVPAVIADAAKYLATGGGMNIFAGVAIGTMAVLDISRVWLSGVRYWGSSGSSIADLRVMLEKTETRQVAPNNSVAAIAGMNAAREGLVGLTEARFPGKTVVFPQFPDLPLTALTDLHRVIPNVAAKLKDGKFWCKQAEDELLRTYLGKEAKIHAA